MTDLLTPVVDAVLAQLAGHSAVQAVLGNPARVYDQRPAMATFPYTVLAAGEGRDVGTKTLAVNSQILTFQVFSRQRGGREVRLVLAALRTALQDAAFTLTSGNLVRCQEEFVAVRYDETTQSGFGTARYRVLVSD